MTNQPKPNFKKTPGVAQRVAEERGESVGGAASSVGYMIRGENRTGPNTRLVRVLIICVGLVLGFGATEAEKDWD